MANMDNADGSGGDGSQAPGPGAGGRRYRKKEKKRGSTQSGDSSSNTSQKGAETEETPTEGKTERDVEIQTIKLNRLSDYEVDNVKMANVFGNASASEGSQKPVSSSMRLNPLYDQDGTVQVTAGQAQVAKLADNSSQDSVLGPEAASGRGKKGTYKHPKKGGAEEEKEERREEERREERTSEPKINYSKNFRFGKPPTDGQNGAANGVKKLTSFGVVMPSRVKQNTIPKNQLVAAGSGPSQYALGASSDKSKSDIEAASRRHEMRRRWRYVIILILIILVFGLILTVVLYFATRSS